MLAFEKLVAKLGSPTVVTVGDVMIDEWFHGSYSRRTKEYGTSTHICDVVKEEVSPGGAANVAKHIASLGAASSLVGVVGTDPGGSQLDFMLRLRNITPNLVRDPSRRTTIKTRVVEKGGSSFYRFDREDRHRLDAIVENELIKHMNGLYAGDPRPVFVISDYGKGVVTNEVAKLLIGSVATVVVDVKRGDYRKYRGADVIKVSDADFSNSDLTELVQSAPLAVTRGREGIELIHSMRPTKVKAIPAFDVFVRDAVGAGDAVVAAVAVALGSGLDLEEAFEVGNLAGAASVTQEGTKEGITKEQMLEVARENPNYRC